KSDGTVVEWGAFYYTPPDVPSGLSNVVAATSGWDHFLALKSDGTVTGWGENNYGQALGGAGLSNLVAISAAGNVSLGLQADGTVAAWGHISPPPNGLSNVVAVATGSGSYITGPADGFALALRNDGRVFGWGNNGSGQSVPPSNLTNVMAIAAGALHALAV